MKKVIALLLALSMCFALCGCGKSKEAMLDEAITLDYDIFKTTIENNPANAYEQYNDKVVKFTARVEEITLEYIIMTDSSGIKVKFNEKEDGVGNISKGDIITVVGVMDVGDYTFTTYITNAYIV